MSFRHKLLASFLGLLATVLGVSLWTIQRLETRRAERELHSGLRLTRELFEDILRQRDRELARSLTLLSGDFAFKQAVATADPATVLSVAVNHSARMGSDVLIVTDGDGLLLADTRRQAKTGRDWRDRPFIRAALEDGSASGIYMLDGVPYQLAAVAVNAPDAIGAAAAGFRIDDRFAASLKRLTLTEVSFLVSGAIVGSTLEPAARAEVAAQAAAVGDSPSVVRLAGERFLAAAAKPHEAVSAIVMRSWDLALAPMRRLQRRLLLIGALGLAATALLGLLIASGITRSLDQLVAAAAKIAVGRYDIAIDIPSRDEIGRLGRAFTSMARGLIEREKIRSVLNKTVSKEIAESLLAKGSIELGGEEKTVTILFSDIRSFTTISEALPPKELVSQLNDYFKGMARAVEAHHGVIDKFIGDAVMALFGAPLASPEDAANALRAALAMAASLDEINAARQSRGLPPWRNGVGVDTGAVVAGTLGSEERWSYTVIGDAVNLASRLEGLTKDYGVKIIVSAKTKAAAGDSFRYRALGPVVVKGKTESVEVYELLGE